MHPAQRIREIYLSSARPLLAALAGIPEEQLNWQPAPDSRSISEIVRHLIRVDIWFLQQFEIELDVADPGDVAPEVLRRHLGETHDGVAALIDGTTVDLSVIGATGRPLAEVLVHMAHHHLYHLAQIIYLRRAQDRSWEPPLSQWEHATYLQGALLIPVARLSGV